MPCSEERTGVGFDLTPGKRCEAGGCGARVEVLTARGGRYSQWCEAHARREVGKAGVMVVRRIEEES